MSSSSYDEDFVNEIADEVAKRMQEWMRDPDAQGEVGKQIVATTMEVLIERCHMAMK